MPPPPGLVLAHLHLARTGRSAGGAVLPGAFNRRRCTTTTPAGGGAPTRACSNGARCRPPSPNSTPVGVGQGRGVSSAPAPTSSRPPPSSTLPDARQSLALAVSRAADPPAPLHARAPGFGRKPQGLQDRRAHPGAKVQSTRQGQLQIGQNSELRTSRLVIMARAIGVLSQEGRRRAEHAAGSAGSGGAGSRRQDHQMQRVEIGGGPPPSPRRQIPLVGDAESVRQSQTALGRLPSRKPQNSAHLLGHLPRPGIGEHRQAAGRCCKLRARGSARGRAALIQLASCQGCRFARTPACRLEGCRIENESCSDGICCNSSRPMPNRGGSRLAGSTVARPAAGRLAAPGSADRACRCCAAPPWQNSPDRLSRRRVPPTAGPVAPAPGWHEEDSRPPASVPIHIKAWRRWFHGFQVPSP